MKIPIPPAPQDKSTTDKQWAEALPLRERLRISFNKEQGIQLTADSFLIHN